MDIQGHCQPPELLRHDTYSHQSDAFYLCATNRDNQRTEANMSTTSAFDSPLSATLTMPQKMAYIP